MSKYISYKGKLYRAIDESSDLESKISELSKKFAERLKSLYICHLRIDLDIINGTIESYSGQFDDDKAFRNKLITLCGRDWSLKGFKIVSQENRSQGYTCKASVKLEMSNDLYYLLKKKFGE